MSKSRLPDFVVKASLIPLSATEGATMIDLSPVKAMLVRALNGAELAQVDADRLAQTVTDHFLNRDKVRAALTDLISGIETAPDYGAIGQLGGRRAYYRHPPSWMRSDIRIEDDLISLLIEALAAGGER